MELIFSEKAYQKFLCKKQTINNKRIRPEGESIWDALASEEADFTKLPEGQEILETFRQLGK
jgi:hypothetical protein